jgi:hypothetical protein
VESAGTWNLNTHSRRIHRLDARNVNWVVTWDILLVNSVGKTPIMGGRGARIGYLGRKARPKQAVCMLKSSSKPIIN